MYYRKMIYLHNKDSNISRLILNSYDTEEVIPLLIRDLFDMCLVIIIP